LISEDRDLKSSDLRSDIVDSFKAFLGSIRA
jgi:hypothetical protein